MKKNPARRSELNHYKKYNVNKGKKKSKKSSPLIAVIIVGIILAALVYGCYNSDIFGSGEKTSESSSSELNYSVTSSGIETSVGSSSEISSNPEDEPGYPFSQVDYYISDRFERYIKFSEANPEMRLEDIVLKVNMNFDYDFYEIIYPITEPSDKLVICNKYYQLSESFIPENLIEIPESYHINDGKKYLLDETALNAFIEMTAAANADGIELRILSAYRSFSYQQGLYNTYVERDGVEEADRYSAKAGHSEHQTGLAVDINLVSQDFENLPEFLWLKENSYKYGFILRYKEGFEWETGYMYEPWHYRYVGKDVAKQIYDEDITFDHYYAKYILPYETNS